MLDRMQMALNDNTGVKKTARWGKTSNIVQLKSRWKSDRVKIY